METAMAHRQPQPRTANDRSRLIVTTLLLLGGAFVLGLVWTIRGYHVISDRVTPYVPETAEMTLTIPFDEGLASVLGSFDGLFGATLNTMRFRKGDLLVFFVDRNVDNGEPFWTLMTDAEVDEDALPEGVASVRFRHLNLVSSGNPEINFLESRASSELKFMKRASGTGFVSEHLLSPGTEWGADTLPMRLSLEEGALVFSVGRRFRGLSGSPEPPQKRQIATLPDRTAAYVIVPPGLIPSIPSGFALESSVFDVMRSAQMMFEMVLLENGRFAALLYDPLYGTPKIEVIEQPILEYLRTLEPKERLHRLPDGSMMIELREHVGKVHIEEKTIINDTLLRTYVSEDGRELSLIIDSEGDIWVTDDVILVSSLLSPHTESAGLEGSCHPTIMHPGVSFDQGIVSGIPMVNSDTKKAVSVFKTISFRIEDAETGLFTFCGYF